MTIQIRRSTDGLKPSQLEGFFVGWPSHPDEATHLRILEKAFAVAIAVDDETGQVVGFANAISDGVLSAYIPLLEVLPPWQGNGLGRRLIADLQEQLRNIYMVDLICDPSLERFYKPLGFVALTGMVHRNYDAQAGA